MTKTYCLAIDVKSPHIESGLGYMLTFHAKDAKAHPEQTEGFDAWAAAVRSAVEEAGDQPFNPDPYTRKVAIAELMYEIEKINSAYPFVIGGNATRPAVEVQSSNPRDNRIVIDFTGEDGQFDVAEKKSRQSIPGRICGEARTMVLEGKTATFPFLPAASGGMAPPAPKNRPPMHWRP